jgi:RNA polymerase sigma-70 factor, ECF subfamily
VRVEFRLPENRAEVYCLVQESRRDGRNAAAAPAAAIRDEGGASGTRGPMALLRTVDGTGEFRLLYERYRYNVFARALSLLGNEEAAKDAMQEVFLRIIDDDRRVLGKSSPMAWLYRVTTNLCLNRMRDEKRRLELLAMRPANDIQSADAEAQAIVCSILRSVPPDLQEIAIYYHVDEMSHEEIAVLVGLSRRTIGNRLLEFDAAMAGVARKEHAS